MSPELFLRVKPDGTAITRPIKGTRPVDTPRAELAASEKDAAELAMIVDLMRNDLGRVAEIGSVSVAEDRVLETHTTVHHGVAEVRAALRDDVEWTELLAATFPPGSVTGAPKVRAMQIIDELEDHERGFYCGAIGFISRSGDCALSVAIRTAQIGAEERGGDDAPPTRSVVYHAGCGIVADSHPEAEVAETHAKARALTQLESAAGGGDVASNP
jgi:para-aminobenzoate synthetase component 1